MPLRARRFKCLFSIAGVGFGDAEFWVVLVSMLGQSGLKAGQKWLKSLLFGVVLKSVIFDGF